MIIKKSIEKLSIKRQLLQDLYRRLRHRWNYSISGTLGERIVIVLDVPVCLSLLSLAR